MFFRITSPPTVTLDDCDDLYRAVSNLVRSFGERKHLVWMSRSAIDFFVQNYGFSQYDLRLIQAIKDSNMELGRFHRELDFYCEVDLNDKFRQEYIEPESCFYIGYGLITDSSRIQPASILAEADFDFEMCKLAASSWLHKVSGFEKSFCCNFDFINGAGGNLFRSYSRAIDSKKFFICIVDSDKKHPLDKLGDTALKVSEIELTPRRCHQVHILEATEMENIIPLDILERAIDNYGNNEAFKDDLIEMARSNNRLFFDHKKGLKIKKVLELEGKHGPYWSASNFYNVENEWLCRGFGNNIGDYCLEIMDGMTKLKISQSISDLNDSYWLWLGRQLFSWGVAVKGKVV